MSFQLDLSKFSKLTEKKMETVVKKVFIGLSTAIIKDTPVDTGRLRNNWFPDINKFNSTTTEREDKSGNVATNRVRSEANIFKLGDTITLTNNLPYAERIEYMGWSNKAPQGMVRLNVLAFQKWVDKTARSVN